MALGLILAGLLLAAVMARQIFESLTPYTWQKSRCLIERSEVLFRSDSEEPCRHLLEYRHEAAGAQRKGSAWRLDPGQPYEWCADWASFAGNFPPQTTVDCFIDPTDASRSVLDRGNLLSVLTLLFPLCFIAGGLLLLRKRSPASKAATIARVRWIARGVAVCATVAGVMGTMYFGIVPLYEIYHAQNWVGTECTVLSSSLKTSTSSGTRTQGSSNSRGYYLRIIYSYVRGQATFVSDRFSFYKFGSGDDNALAQVTSRYPLESKFQCWTDAENPYEAVIDREFSMKYLLGFLPLIAAFGGIGLFVTARRLK